MAEHNQLGKRGENLAELYLKKNSFEIICKNYQYSHYEIDIIAKKNEFLHFIEVKTRSSIEFSFPEESLNIKKKKNLKIAASHYLFSSQWKGPIQFDLLIVMIQQATEKITFIEDVIN